MGKTYIGVDDTAKQVRGIYLGVNDVARKVRRAYIGNQYGRAKIVFDNVMPVLPDEYQQSEYIMARGAGAIDLGFQGTQTLGFDIDYINVQNLSTAGTIFGARGSTANTTEINFSSYGSNKNGYWVAGAVNNGIGMTINTRITHSYRSTGVMTKPDGTMITCSHGTSFKTSKNLYLGCFNQNGTLNSHGYFVLFSLKFYNVNTLIHDYVPCYEKSTKTAGIYDLVDDKFLSGGSWIYSDDYLETKKQYFSVPSTFTSNTSYSPIVVSCSSIGENTSYAWKAFDATPNSTYWRPQRDTAAYPNPYIMIDCGEPIIPRLFYIRTKGTAAAWNFERCNDGSSWVKDMAHNPSSTSSVSYYTLRYTNWYPRFRYFRFYRAQTTGTLDFYLYQWMIYGWKI